MLLHYIRSTAYWKTPVCPNFLSGWQIGFWVHCILLEKSSHKEPLCHRRQLGLGQFTDTPLSTGIVRANRNSECDLLTRSCHCHCQSRAPTVSMVERHFTIFMFTQWNKNVVLCPDPLAHVRKLVWCSEWLFCHIGWGCYKLWVEYAYPEACSWLAQETSQSSWAFLNHSVWQFKLSESLSPTCPMQSWHT